MAKNESGLRYQDYLNQLNQKNTAAGLATGLNGADNANLSAFTSAANSAGNYLTDAANNNALTIGGLLGSYKTTTENSSPSLLQLWASLANSAASAAAKVG